MAKKQSLRFAVAQCIVLGGFLVPHVTDAAVAAPVATQAPADFIASVAKSAQKSQRATGVPASVTIAQAALETAWGESQQFKKDHNAFGIKCATGGSHGKYATGCRLWKTAEVINGKTKYVNASFRVYPDVAASFTDHGDFLRTNTRYAAAFRHTDNPAEFARQLQKAGYATDPLYADKLIRTINANHLTRYDLSPQVILKPGMSGDRVKALQWLLRDAGCQVPVTGYYGSITASCVTSYQKRHKLPANGVAGTSTLASLPRAVEFGATGDAVRAAQVLLTVHRHAVPVTGYFGPLTRQATIAWQRQQHLPVIGVVGPLTWASLWKSVSPPPTTTGARAMLEVASKEVGYPEGSRNANKFGRSFGHDHEEWCDFFVKWVAARSGNTAVVGSSPVGRTTDHAAWFKARGQWLAKTVTPPPGAIVFFDFGTGHIQHVGIVEAVNADGTISTIEGNTPDPQRRRGEGVYRKTRTPATLVAGYGVPAYRR